MTKPKECFETAYAKDTWKDDYIVVSLNIKKVVSLESYVFLQVKSVIRWLNNECLQTGFSTEEEWNKLEMDSSGTRFILNNFTKLVDQLRAQNKLPALVFRYEHVFCLHAV